MSEGEIIGCAPFIVLCLGKKKQVLSADMSAPIAAVVLGMRERAINVL